MPEEIQKSIRDDKVEVENQALKNAIKRIYRNRETPLAFEALEYMDGWQNDKDAQVILRVLSEPTAEQRHVNATLDRVLHSIADEDSALRNGMTDEFNAGFAGALNAVKRYVQEIRDSA